jgi:hypothetical protein
VQLGERGELGGSILVLTGGREAVESAGINRWRQRVLELDGKAHRVRRSQSGGRDGCNVEWRSPRRLL